MTTPTYPRWVTPLTSYERCREVYPGLYIGAWAAIELPSWDTLVCVAPIEGGSVAARKASIPHVLDAHIDAREPVTSFAKAADIAWGAWQDAELRRCPVLIACHAGLNRSAAVAYALLRRRYGFDHAETLARVEVPGYVLTCPKKEWLQIAARWL